MAYGGPTISFIEFHVIGVAKPHTEHSTFMPIGTALIKIPLGYYIQPMTEPTEQSDSRRMLKLLIEYSD